jgi:hypothetical protein
VKEKNVFLKSKLNCVAPCGARLKGIDVVISSNSLREAASWVPAGERYRIFLFMVFDPAFDKKLKLNLLAAH